MKNRFKYLIVICLLIFIVPCSVHAEKKVYGYDEINNYEVFIDDQIDMFSDSEKEELSSIMKKSVSSGNIGLVVVNQNSYSTEDFAEKYYHDNYETKSGTIFVIDMGERYLYIFSSGTNYDKLTSYTAKTIADNVYKLAKSEKYFKCAKKAFIQINRTLVGDKVFSAMKVICNAILSLSLSFTIVFFIAREASRIKKSSKKELLNTAGKNMEIENFDVIEMGTHTVYNPPVESSGGGGGSSGGGGGGSSGGGGGHGF